MQQAVVGVIAAAVVLSACGGSPESATAIHSEEEPHSGATAAEVSRGGPEELLTISASTIDGDQFEGAGLIGRDVAIWFWAPW